MTIGIVGHEAAKFTAETQEHARQAIRDRLSAGVTRVVSGKCHLGGVDVWAIEEAQWLGIYTQEFEPTRRTWSGIGGFMARNIRIAAESDHVVVIVVRTLPPSYRGMQFPLCYHCKTTSHVKSGGCWTAKHAQQLGKTAEWVEI